MVPIVICRRQPPGHAAKHGDAAARAHSSVAFHRISISLAALPACDRRLRPADSAAASDALPQLRPRRELDSFRMGASSDDEPKTSLTIALSPSWPREHGRPFAPGRASDALPPLNGLCFLPPTCVPFSYLRAI
ncbi:hypothetical protein DCS_03415 [Drechmeria coniospora]|uniref:Uncharacterized protein n=1 Tax=Drechmeria coniospora TaxID=98403 RepID=A0A151GH45_DRECN|nr:hypothetical protein DCS_03415 [Drechmeria coniospora]KYK56415.1 hypothetical protein DCS_03415 [Drechmeria coniospora]